MNAYVLRARYMASLLRLPKEPAFPKCADAVLPEVTE